MSKPLETATAPAFGSSVRAGYEKRLMVTAGRASRELAGRIADKLELGLTDAGLKTFADGEVYCRYAESIRGAARLYAGAQIVADPAQPKPMTMIGHVTSSYWSDALGRSIAMALLENGRARMGETLFVPMPGGAIEVEVCNPVFFDEKGGRLNG